MLHTKNSESREFLRSSKVSDLDEMLEQSLLNSDSSQVIGTNQEF